MCFVNRNSLVKTGMVLLAASATMLISSGCISQARYEEEARTHYASYNVINANELEEFAIGCPQEVTMKDAQQATITYDRLNNITKITKEAQQTKTTTYQIEAFKPTLQGQVLYVLRSKIVISPVTGQYPIYETKEESTELNALDVNSGDWLWSSWVPIGGRYNDSAIAPDGKTMAVITSTNKGGTTNIVTLLSIHNLELEGQPVSNIWENLLFMGAGTNLLRFSSDGKYLAVFGINPEHKPFHSSLFAVNVYQLPLSDYDNAVKRPITIPMDVSLPQLRYESDPITPSHLHIFRENWGKTYHGMFDTETGQEIASMHLREDLRNTSDVSVAGNRILVIHGGDLTIFKPGDLTEVDMQFPLVVGGWVVSKTEKFVAIGALRYLVKDRPYILSIFDARNLNKPPSEVRILGLYPPKDNYTPPPTAIVGDYLLVLRVHRASEKGTQCDSCTILRYNLRKIPSLWAQDEGTQ